RSRGHSGAGIRSPVGAELHDGRPDDGAVIPRIEESGPPCPGDRRVATLLGLVAPHAYLASALQIVHPASVVSSAGPVVSPAIATQCPHGARRARVASPT